MVSRSLLVRLALLIAALGLPCCGGSVGAGSGGGSGTGSGGSGSGSGGGSQAAPLGASEFVFVREVRAGVNHVLAHDVGTGAERLVSALDDDGQSGTAGPVRLDVSPDRRRIAFTATFRPEAADADNPAEAVWTMDATGGSLTRLTPPLPTPFTQRCSGDANCLRPERCYSGICKKPSFRTEILDPEFTADGRTVFFSMGQSWLDGTSVAGGVGVSSVPAAGGTIATHAVEAGCQVAAAPSVNAGGTALAVVRSVCASSADGIYRYDLPISEGPGALLVSDEDPIASLGGGKPYWWGDAGGDQGLLFLASASGMSGNGVIGLEFATGDGTILFDPPGGGFAEAFTVSPDHHWMVVCAYQGSARDLYLVDLSGSSAAVPLTEDGESCYPAW